MNREPAALEGVRSVSGRVSRGSFGYQCFNFHGGTTCIATIGQQDA